MYEAGTRRSMHTHYVYIRQNRDSGGISRGKTAADLIYELQKPSDSVQSQEFD